MDHMKVDPVIWKIWSVTSFKEFNNMMFRLRKTLGDSGAHSLIVVDQSSVERDNPVGFAIFWPKNGDEAATIERFISTSNGVYYKVMCDGG